jgi:hypothetical protein
MVSKKDNPRTHVVYNNSELNAMRKYLKDINMLSNTGNYPKYEIGKLANMIELGGETVEHYLKLVE